MKQHTLKITLFSLLIGLITPIYTSSAINANNWIKSSQKTLNSYFQYMLMLLTNHPVVSLTDNFHTVENNKLYRSKTLSKEKLEHYIQKHNIRTILNLRAYSETDQWYKDEKEIANKYNIPLISIPLGFDGFPTQEQIKSILHVFETAELPLLVHCKAGADRTGLVSALWVLEKMKGNLEKALNELSRKFAHEKYLHQSMHAFIKAWHDLKQNHPDVLEA